MNKSLLTGRITKEVELRKTPNGTSIVNFTLACNRKFKQQGQPDADFIQCVAWGKIADLMNDSLHKGSLIGIEGRIQTRSYNSQQGQRIFVTEIIVESLDFLEPKSHNMELQLTMQYPNQGYDEYEQDIYSEHEDYNY